MMSLWGRPVLNHLLVALYIALRSPDLAAEKLASIIIDDLGNSLDRGAAVLDIEAPLTLAILPLTDFGATLARIAHRQGKEVMLHLPLQSIESHPPTPGTLHLHMTHQQFVRQLEANLASVPHVSGLNNHMGSLLTQHPGHMGWLMQELGHRDGLYFIDSRTTTKSVVAEYAGRHSVPQLERDIFLDPDFSLPTLRRQFDRFIDIANRNGRAIAIAHPHPRTLEFISMHLNELDRHGIVLVPVSALLKRQQHEESTHVARTGTPGTGL